jgi:uncharacterized protein YcbK (DUF882 family)
MRSFVVAMVIVLAFAGQSLAQTPEVLRGTSSDLKKVQAKPAVHKTGPTTPQTLRGSRYGGFAPVPAQPVTPPALDLNSPRSLTLVNVNSQEVLTVTYWSDGAYHRDALNKLNAFLRDSQNNAQTEMDPLLFDVLWHSMNLCGYSGPVEVLSAYRSPTTNAWLASVSRGVARDSQHMNGNAMDIRFPGIPVFKIRQAARSLQMGGVGFYPRSGFVHLDTGPIRYW